MAKNLFLFLLPCLLLACSAPEQGPSGEQLARVHCASCHTFPKPGLLDKPTWQAYILPRMGYLMGVGLNDSLRRELLEEGEARDRVLQAGLFPDSARLSLEEWQKIRDYYLTQAPERLPAPAPDSLGEVLPGFRLRKPEFRLSPPSTTLVQVREEGGFYLGDANTRTLYQFRPDLSVEGGAVLGEGPVSLTARGQALYVTVMGSFSPTDAAKGFLAAVPRTGDRQPEFILRGLQRPVHSSVADLNGDGRPDLLVSEFGKWTGELAWWENQGAEGLKKHVLRSLPGSIRTEVRDLNGDGLPDILALCAQAQEGVWLFLNQGEGRFSSQPLLDFPPSYGLSAMEVLDWNGDGAPDLLLCAGDNADYPPVTKPYHGLRLYLNDGQNHFSETWFYPLPGAYGTQTRDFDQDGDLDIAAVSFFPEYTDKTPRAFVFLENTGGEHFQSHTLPQLARLGRWMLLDAGDIDRDGDEDLLLGALTLEVPGGEDWVEGWKREGLAFVVMENIVIE